MGPAMPHPNDALETSENSDGLGLASIYLRLIADQKRRLAAYERAIQEERNQLADMPDLIADLEARIATEERDDMRELLQAKLTEAQAEFGTVLRRSVQREADWPARKTEILGEIAKIQETIDQINGKAA